MKKIYLAAMAVAALTVSSCSQDEVLNMNPEAGAKAIEFGVYTGKTAESRAAITTDGAIKADKKGFGVTAVYTGETLWASVTQKKANFMWNQQVLWDASGGTDSKGVWTYDPVKYWPTNTGDKLSFFAYAPYQPAKDGKTGDGAVIEFTHDDTDASQIVYNHQNPLSNNVDFVAASAIDQDESTESSKIIKFEMKHELTRLSISAKVKVNDKATENVFEENNPHNKTKLVITNMYLDYVGTPDAKFYESATYTFNTTATADAVGTWTVDDDDPEIEQNFDLNTAIAYTSIDEAVCGKTYTQTEAPNGIFVLEGTTEQNLCGGEVETGNHLFMIPAIPNNGTGTGISVDNIKLVVKYDIVTEDASIDCGYSCTTATKTIPVEFKDKDGVKATRLFEQGKAYNFVITFAVNEVKLEGSPADWKNLTGDGEVNSNSPDKDEPQS